MDHGPYGQGDINGDSWWLLTLLIAVLFEGDGYACFFLIHGLSGLLENTLAKVNHWRSSPKILGYPGMEVDIIMWHVITQAQENEEHIFSYVETKNVDHTFDSGMPVTTGWEGEGEEGVRKDWLRGPKL